MTVEFMRTSDIDERIEELEELSNHLDECREEYIEAVEDVSIKQETLDHLHKQYHTAVEDFSAEEEKELADLKAFKDELEDYCDWKHGETLIHKDARVDYAEQLAQDLGTISGDQPWPLNHIDWKAAAEELFKYDYTYADLSGDTYYVRNN
jgi:DNA repair exonuclease SbcCD ATPase subunit